MWHERLRSISGGLHSQGAFLQLRLYPLEGVVSWGSCVGEVCRQRIALVQFCDPCIAHHPLHFINCLIYRECQPLPFRLSCDNACPQAANCASAASAPQQVLIRGCWRASCAPMPATSDSEVRPPSLACWCSIMGAASSVLAAGDAVV